MCLITVVYVCDHVSGIFETADGESWCPRQTASTVVCWPVGREEQWVGESNRWIYLKPQSRGKLGQPVPVWRFFLCGSMRNVLQTNTLGMVVWFSGRKRCLRQIKWFGFRIVLISWQHQQAIQKPYVSKCVHNTNILSAVSIWKCVRLTFLYQHRANLVFHCIYL